MTLGGFTHVSFLFQPEVIVCRRFTMVVPRDIVGLGKDLHLRIRRATASENIQIFI